MRALYLVAGILVTGLSAAGCGLAGPAQSSKTEPVNGALVTADGLRIIVAAMEGGCDRAHLTAGERPAQVALTLSIATTVPRGAACATVAIRVTLSTTLRRPLWGRRLIDAATGRPVRYFDGRQLPAHGLLQRHRRRVAIRPRTPPQDRGSRPGSCVMISHGASRRPVGTQGFHREALNE